MLPIIDGILMSKTTIACVILLVLLILNIFLLISTKNELDRIGMEYRVLLDDYHKLKSSHITLIEEYNKILSTLNNLTHNYEEIKAKYNKLYEEYLSLLDSYNELALNNTYLRRKIYELEIENSDLLLKLTYFENQTLYRDPTYRELMKFLKEDTTDEKEYIEGKYTCEHFAADLNNNAERRGIRCAFVILHFKSGHAHVIVAFKTIDKGIVYVEPQTDDLVKVGIGVRYFRDNGFEYPGFDDTIVEIVVVW